MRSRNKIRNGHGNFLLCNGVMLLRRCRGHTPDTWHEQVTCHLCDVGFSTVSNLVQGEFHGPLKESRLAFPWNHYELRPVGVLTFHSFQAAIQDVIRDVRCASNDTPGKELPQST